MKLNKSLKRLFAITAVTLTLTLIFMYNSANVKTKVALVRQKIQKFSSFWKYKSTEKLSEFEGNLFGFLSELNMSALAAGVGAVVGERKSRMPLPKRKSKSKSEALFEKMIPSSSAIVMTIADSFVPQALHSVEMLRILHHSTLDIVIVHNGNELSPENRAKIIQKHESALNDQYTMSLKSSKPTSSATSARLSIVDLAFVVGVRVASRIKKFNMKPFAILAALEYDNVILIDADVFFFKPPELLLAHPLFLEAGALFFRDRLIKDPLTTRAQMDKIVQAASMVVFDAKRPVDADDGLDNRYRLYKDIPEFFVEKETIHVMESGVVVLSKRRNFVELLAVLLLNEKSWIRDSFLDRYFYGDKELFWLGFELARYRADPPFNYKFAPLEWTGAIGTADRARQKVGWKSESLCSAQILHAISLVGADGSLVPMWMNGGFLKNKYDNSGSGDGGEELMSPSDFSDWMIPALDIDVSFSSFFLSANASDAAAARKRHYSWYFEKNSNYLACLECEMRIVSGADKETDLPMGCARSLSDSMLFKLKRGLNMINVSDNVSK